MGPVTNDIISEGKDWEFKVRTAQAKRSHLPKQGPRKACMLKNPSSMPSITFPKPNSQQEDKADQECVRRKQRYNILKM